MLRFILRRLAILPIAILLIHFLGFTYAYVARPIRASRTPYLREQVNNPLPLLESYQQHVQDIFDGSLLKPIQKGPQIGSFAGDLGKAFIASIGLLAIALVLSTHSGPGIWDAGSAQPAARITRMVYPVCLTWIGNAKFLCW